MWAVWSRIPTTVETHLYLIQGATPRTDMSLEQTQEGGFPTSLDSGLTPLCHQKPWSPSSFKEIIHSSKHWLLLQNILKPRYEVPADQAGAAGGEVGCGGAPHVSLSVRKLRDSSCGSSCVRGSNVMRICTPDNKKGTWGAAYELVCLLWQWHTCAHTPTHYTPATPGALLRKLRQTMCYFFFLEEEHPSEYSIHLHYHKSTYQKNNKTKNTQHNFTQIFY